MFTGLTLADMRGVPLGTALGPFAGWRATFWAVCAFGVAAGAALMACVPGGMPGSRGGLLGGFRSLRRWPVLVSTLASVSLSPVFTYIVHRHHAAAGESQRPEADTGRCSILTYETVAGTVAAIDSPWHHGTIAIFRFPNRTRGLSPDRCPFEISNKMYAQAPDTGRDRFLKGMPLMSTAFPCLFARADIGIRARTVQNRLHLGGHRLVRIRRQGSARPSHVLCGRRRAERVPVALGWPAPA